MESLDSSQVMKYLNEAYPRLDYHCDEHFKLFELCNIDIESEMLRAHLRIKDVKAYGPFPPLELHHAIMVNNLLVLTYGNHMDMYVSALIKKLSSECNRPVFVDEDIQVVVKFENMHHNTLTVSTTFNKDAFILQMDLLCFKRPGMLGKFVMRRRKV